MNTELLDRLRTEPVPKTTMDVLRGLVPVWRNQRVTRRVNKIMDKTGIHGVRWEDGSVTVAKQAEFPGWHTTTVRLVMADYEDGGEVSRVLTVEHQERPFGAQLGFAARMDLYDDRRNGDPQVPYYSSHLSTFPGNDQGSLEMAEVTGILDLAINHL